MKGLTRRSVFPICFCCSHFISRLLIVPACSVGELTQAFLVKIPQRNLMVRFQQHTLSPSLSSSGR